MINLEGKTVLVTGPESMIGRFICQSLKQRNANVFEAYHNEFDLLDPKEAIRAIMMARPNYIIHAAGWNGGIGWNKEYPEEIFYRTVAMGINVFKGMCLANSNNEHKIKKAVHILASCAYPDLDCEEFNEDQLWDGECNSTVECHGLAKRCIEAYIRQINKQHSMKNICCILNNSYGPHDSFHPDKTKVIGALIRRFVEAKQNETKSVECWGTGAPLREFVYAADAGEAIVQCLERYDDPSSPINIGSGFETSIKELTETIVKIVGYEGEVKWDITKPDGQMKKKLCTKKMKSTLPLFSPTSIEDGIKATVDWYIDNQEEANSKGVKF